MRERDSGRPAEGGVLLLQVRDHAGAEAQEQACFTRACGLENGELATWNVVGRPEITWDDVAGAGVLIVGGAGEHSATKHYEFTPRLERVLERWFEEERPFFGSCFGHHFVAAMLGGEVIVDGASEEVGSFDVALTQEGVADPLFSELPRQFTVHLGHHDRVARLPLSARSLAHSERCTNQALRINGGPIYTTQFHPELSRADMRERLLMYCDGYLESDEGLAEVSRRLRPAPEAYGILRRFFEICG